MTAARLVRDVMRLALLLYRRYAPYQKWLGTAFARAGYRDGHSDGLPRQLGDAVHAADVGRRERALADAYVSLARRHNAAALTEHVEPSIGGFYGRPGRVLMAGRFTAALLATVTDPGLRGLPLIGSIDQAVDCTDVLGTPATYRRLAGLYTVGPLHRTG